MLLLNRYSAFSLAAALLFFAGCGSDKSPARQPISGTITLDNKALDSGTITFVPEEGGPGAFGTIQGGSYQFGAADGPPPGRYKVEITNVQPTGKMVDDPDSNSGKIAEVRNVIPPQFNARTELVAEVKSGQDNAFPFALTSRKAGPRSSRR